MCGGRGPQVMIWADRVAIALAVLVAFGFGMAFVSSDAALRMETLRAREANFNAACAPSAGAPTSAAEAPGQDASKEGQLGSAAAPLAADAEAAGQQQPALPEASISDDASTAPAEVAPLLPSRICTDPRLRDEVEAEEAAITVPTVRSTFIDIGKAELFGVVPFWVGLRILDFWTGGPQRRLARTTYWMATNSARKARRRRRRARRESSEEQEL